VRINGRTFAVWVLYFGAMFVAHLPARVSLARLPTPVERLSRLSRELGVTLLVKRDDLTGAPLSGNKVRKLEFSLAEAGRQDATCVLTTGGAQSNHCRATAVAGRRLGLAPYLLLRTEDGGPPADLDGNLLLDWLVGAKLRYITPAEYANRDILLARWADELRLAGERPFVIPEGASDPLGALGYVVMAHELADQLAAGDVPGKGPVEFLVHACGSGGTAAGIAAGLQLLDLPIRLVAYAVCDDAQTFRARIDSILEGLAGRYLPGLDPASVSYEVVDGYQGRGYGLSTPEELALLRRVASVEGLLLDPVYTGKAFRGLVEDVRSGVRYPQGSRIMFLHTGGLFGVFPKRAELLTSTDEKVVLS